VSYRIAILANNSKAADTMKGAACSPAERMLDREPVHAKAPTVKPAAHRSLFRGKPMTNTTKPIQPTSDFRSIHAQEPTATRSAPAGSPRFLDTRGAASLLGISPRTLEKYRVCGGGPAYRKLGARVLYAHDRGRKTKP